MKYRALNQQELLQVSGGISPTGAPEFELKYYAGPAGDIHGYGESGYDVVPWDSLDKRGLANGDRTG